MRLRPSLAKLATIAFAIVLSATLAPVSVAGQGAHDHGSIAMQTGDAPVRPDTTPDLPPDAEHALARLNASPRHGQYVMVPRGNGDSLRAWIVYPERATKAPVIVVVHEIFGMSTWVRAVADQLAAAGYIAIAPDFLTGKSIPGAPDSISLQDGIAAVSKLDPAAVQHDIDAAAHYAMTLPSALPKYGVVGFCWGGGVAFQHAVHAPTLGAAVVYYGTSPPSPSLASVRAPVLGLYGGSDARVVMTIPPADSAMRALGKTYVHHVYDGATHGFLRQQTGAAGANEAATRQAWPATIAWFRRYLGA
jgi:carboxymethylenebutenolidase